MFQGDVHAEPQRMESDSTDGLLFVEVGDQVMEGVVATHQTEARAINAESNPDLVYFYESDY